MDKAGEIYLYYLKSTTLRQAVEELKDIDLECSADAYKSRYGKDKINGDLGEKLILLSLVEAARVVKTMKALYGTPVSYEIYGYFGESKPKLGWIPTPARIVQWMYKGLGQALRMSNTIAELNVTYYTTKSCIKVFIPVDCFVPILLKSDL